MPGVIASESGIIELIGAEEPWPDDAKIYQPIEMTQILLPESASCLSVQAFLRMCSLQFEVIMAKNAEHMSPLGRVPFLKCGNFVVAGMDRIVAFVNTKGISISQHLDGAQKADMRAYMSLISVVLVNAELYITWCHDTTLQEVTKPRFMSAYPWPINHVLYWKKKSIMKLKLAPYQWADKNIEEIYGEVSSCCHALSERLGKQQYFFGDRPTELDALVFGHLYTLLTTPLPDNGLATIVKEFKNLLQLCQRIEKEYFRKSEEDIIHYSSY